MAKIPRKVAKIFGSTASAGDIRQFGSFAAGAPVTTTDPATIQALANWLTGWLGAVVGGNSPTIEDMNAICYVFAYQLSYLMQEGIAEWETNTIYYKGSLASDGNGVVYVSLTDSNSGNALTSTSNWAFKDGGIPASSTITVAIQSGGYLVDTSGGNITANLPVASSSRGAMVSFKNATFGGANHIAITPNGSDNIEGANAAFNVNAGEFVKLFCDGTAWYLWNV